MTGTENSTPIVLSEDERAAVRAFLQRCEVRLSTLHRVATALLSGAGLVVLLPAIERDAVIVVLRALVVNPDWVRLTLAGAMALVVALPLLALWMLLRELTRFYFHSHHIEAVRENSDAGPGGSRVVGPRVFVPRFTLTGVRIPADELGPEARAVVSSIRQEPGILELLVPDKESTRARIDRQLGAYGQQVTTDIGRAEGLLALVASKDRSLLEEAAKVEAGLARHLLRLQTIVLRYVKALLIFVVTAIVVFAAAAVVDGVPTQVGPLSVARTQALGLIVAVWAPVVALVVGTPVRWVESLLRSEGAVAASVAADPELTQMERVAIVVSSLGWVLSMVVIAGLWVQADSHQGIRIGASAAVILAGIAQLWSVWRWRKRTKVSI
jgi:hypothetical protein